MQTLIERLLGRPFMAAEMGGEGGGDDEAAAAAAAPAGSDDGDEGEGDEGTEIEASGAEDEGDGEGDDGEEGSQRAAPEDDGTTEIDWNGKKVRVLKELVPHLMMERDYTNKSKELSRQTQALMQAVQQDEEAQKKIIDKRGQLAHAEDMLSRYSQINWAQIEAEDPATAQTRLRELHQWEMHRDKLAKDVEELTKQQQSAAQQRSLAAQQDFAKRQQEAQQELHRDIPNWSTVGPKVAEFGMQKLGFSRQELESLADSRVGKLMHLAWLGHEMVSKQKAAVQKKAKAETVEAAPAVTIRSRSGGPAARVTKDKASMDQYVAIRAAEEKAKRAARA